MAGMASGVVNSVARVVMVLSSRVLLPALSVKKAVLSPVKTMVAARVPEASLTSVLRWVTTVAALPSNLTTVAAASSLIMLTVSTTAISFHGTWTWRCA